MTETRLNATLPEKRFKRAEYLTSGLLIIIAAFFTILIVIKSQTSVPAIYAENRIDPIVFRAAGELLQAGELPYSKEKQMDWIAKTRMNGVLPSFSIPFSYPPNALPIFHLRAFGDPLTNVIVHMIVLVLTSLIVYTILISRYLKRSIKRLALLLVAAFFYPSLFDILLGQTGHLIALLVFSWVLLFRKKPILAGIILGILAFKPQYAIPLGIVALSQQNWRMITSSALSFGFMCALSMLLYGFDAWSEFFVIAKMTNTTLPFMASWLGLAAFVSPQAINFFYILAMPLYILSMSILLLTLRRLQNKLDILDATSLSIMVTLIFSPNTHPYDLILAMLPALSLSRRYRSGIWIALLFMVVYSVPLIVRMRYLFAIVSMGITLWLIQKSIKNSGFLEE